MRVIIISHRKATALVRYDSFIFFFTLYVHLKIYLEEWQGHLLYCFLVFPFRVLGAQTSQRRKSEQMKFLASLPDPVRRYSVL